MPGDLILIGKRTIQATGRIAIGKQIMDKEGLNQWDKIELWYRKVKK